MKIELISLKSQCLDGSRELKAEESFTVSNESVANLLVKTGRARYVTKDEGKRQYKRRDMQAEK